MNLLLRALAIVLACGCAMTPVLALANDSTPAYTESETDDREEAEDLSDDEEDWRG